MGKSKSRKPVRQEKELMRAAGLIVKNWLVLKNTDEELQLVSRARGKTRRIKKEKVNDKRRVSKPRTCHC